MTQALAIYDEMSLPSIAEAMFKSGLFGDTKSAAQAIVKVIAGRELGLGPVAAMRGIDLIKGNISLSASLTAALVKQTGRYTYYVVEHSDKTCSIEFHERDPLTGGWQPMGTSTFTMKMAERAGLLTYMKDGKVLQSESWKNYPEAMLWARAMTQGAGWYCPDATEGRFYTAEELGVDQAEAVGTGHGEQGDPATGVVYDLHETPGSDNRSGSEQVEEASLGKGRTTPHSDPDNNVSAGVSGPANPQPALTPTSGEVVQPEESSPSASGPTSPDHISSEQIHYAFGGKVPAGRAAAAMFPNHSVHSLTQSQRRELLASAPDPDQTSFKGDRG